MLKLIESTVTFDLPQEIGVLHRLDEARDAVKAIVDLPNQKMNLLLSLLYQNRGLLAANKRKAHIAELTVRELEAIEKAFQAAFQLQAT